VQGIFLWRRIPGGGAALAFLATLLLGTAALPADRCVIPPFTYRHGVVTFSEGGRRVDLRVLVADTPDKQEYGLMCRTSLPADEGMLFVFADVTRVPFWMKNTLIPLSIAFIDDRWRIVQIRDMAVEPDPEHPTTLYTPPRPYRYALEVNQGFFAQHGLDTRAVVQFTPAESQ
jgi:uncharacterized membrane protein (UPF0127 family)